VSLVPVCSSILLRNNNCLESTNLFVYLYSESIPVIQFLSDLSLILLQVCENNIYSCASSICQQLDIPPICMRKLLKWSKLELPPNLQTGTGSNCNSCSDTVEFQNTIQKIETVHQELDDEI